MRAGKVSVLALVEVAFAIALYWCLVYAFNWQWLHYLHLFLAPLLLLRSPHATRRGIAILRRDYARKPIPYNTFIALILFSSVILTFTGAVAAAAYRYLPLIPAAIFFGPFFGVLLLTAASPVSFYSSLSWKVFVNKVGSNERVNKGNEAAKVDRGPILLKAATFILALPAVIFMAIVVGAGLFFYSFNLASGVATGILLRALSIRWFCVLANISPGLACLPNNWRETVFGVDFFHLPAIFPRAGVVSSFFDARLLYRKILTTDLLTAVVWTPTLVILVGVTTIYRWSLKSSVWFWWPMAFLLIDPMKGRSNSEIREDAASATLGRWTLMLPVALFILAWLVASAAPNGDLLLRLLSEDLAKNAASISQAIAAPAFGLLQISLWCFALLGLYMVLVGRDFAASHDTPLKSPVDHEQMTLEQLQRFNELSRKLARIRTILTLNILVAGELSVVRLMLVHAPHLAKEIFPRWLLEVL